MPSVDTVVFLIWEAIPHQDIRDHKELVGVVIGDDYVDAVAKSNEVLDKLRATEEPGILRGSNFWKEQATVLTAWNCVVA